MSTAQTKRPTAWDEDVIRAAVDALWPKVADWAGDKAPTDPTAIEDMKASLRKAFMSSIGDGYEIAKELDHDGWDVDASLVDVMDGAAFDILRAEREAVRRWVAAGGVVADLPVGTMVRHRALGSTSV
mgnify:CR=1 FL=1